ncbi:MAG: hypothetical protein ACR2RB_10560 [Gammaproteobacteria bacterium]
MNVVYYVGRETRGGVEKISPIYSDSIEALIELETLRDRYPNARVCEEYCTGMEFDAVQ